MVLGLFKRHRKLSTPYNRCDEPVDFREYRDVASKAESSKQVQVVEKDDKSVKRHPTPSQRGNHNPSKPAASQQTTFEDLAKRGVIPQSALESQKSGGK
ncbi:hypothetical protein ACLMJK_004239 [Lecanora helva]